METIFKVQQLEAKTLVWWYSRKSKIDMNPQYQRRSRLWSETDKAYLIDSILNGYDIPKLYIADFTWGNSRLNLKKLPYAIIDGKQRLEAIFEFKDGTIALNDDFVYLKNKNLKLGGLGYKDLQKNYKEIAEDFDNYNLMIMGVFTEDEKLINELFIRLNRSKPLTGAEIRNAMTGHAPRMIREIATTEFFKTNICFNVTRGQDLNVAAKFLLFEYYDDCQDTTKQNLDRFVKDTSTKKVSEKLELTARRVFDVLNDMSNIFLPKDKLLNSSGILPVYYWFIKNIDANKHAIVRKFFLNFEEQRRINREFVREGQDSKKISPTLIEYDNWNRSTNNQQSHKERFKILNNYFNIFIKK